MDGTAAADVSSGWRRRKGVRSSSQNRLMICFRPSSGRRDDTAADGGSGARRIPTHLVVTINGIIGSADNWRFAAKQFVKRYPEDFVVHCSECNYATLTFDGVDVMGERLAKEVSLFVKRRPALQKISFVGHSLGGLVARYAIARLYERGDIKDCSTENGSCKFQQSDEPSEQNLGGKISGLEPVNFITFATPHLGSRFHKQIPMLLGSYALEKLVFRISGIAGRSGKHLFLKDHDEGKPPLLLRMITDSGDLKFISALRSFHRRVAYSNARYDFIVGWKTSSIRRQHELPKPNNFTKDSKYPHVVFVEKPKNTDVKQDGFIESMIYDPKSADEMEELMIKGLNKVPWERVDVSFRKSKQRVFAHSTIQVKSKLLNSDGADVIFHMIDNFLL
ncbi:putative lipase YOR059C [Phalaenopsis equestris]|uniref:putative lipase YOR059C n=1 Tax=Phalaenopsis equestris TaxID=78828 RepID=UPI0009E4E0DB|nr:putative lipase YOR059C [Phalaenopsis equestris]